MSGCFFEQDRSPWGFYEAAFLGNEANAAGYIADNEVDFHSALKLLAEYFGDECARARSVDRKIPYLRGITGAEGKTHAKIKRLFMGIKYLFNAHLMAIK